MLYIIPQDLSDLSDTEMFKLDDMLAEVFRQKKKIKDRKKIQGEKNKEMGTFRIKYSILINFICYYYILERLCCISS